MHDLSSSPPDRLLAQAADLVRGFNHASRTPGDGWTYPAHSSTALGALAHLTGMLEQAIGQITRPVTRTHEHGRLLIDGGGDPNASLTVLSLLQQRASEHARLLARSVGAMHAAVAPMGLDTIGLPEFADDGPGDEAAPACARCRTPFDPADTRSDGRARHRLSDYCRRCISNCHEGGAEHVCVICDPARYRGGR